MWDSHRRNLRKAVRSSSGLEKGLLVANYEAEREVYGATSLTRSTLSEGITDIGTQEDVRQFLKILGAQERLSAYLTNVQTSYLQLRERLALLTGVFLVFKQSQYFEELLNDLSWESGKRAAALRERIVSNSHRMLLGDITFDDEGRWIHIGVSQTGKEIAFTTIEAIQAHALHLKTKIAVARDFMEERAIHLKAYEAYLDGIEGELRELILAAQCQLYNVGSQLWNEIREFLAQRDDDFLRMIEALPDYDALIVDEEAYNEEEEIILGY